MTGYNIFFLQCKSFKSVPPRFFEVVTSMERRNVTIGGNVTEVQEFVTYDITQLRMDPDYIRSWIYIVYFNNTLPEEGLLGYISPRNFPEALKWNLEDSWDFPWVSGCRTHGLEKYLRHWDGFPRTLLVMVEHRYNRFWLRQSVWDGTQNVKRYRYGYFFR